MMRNITEYHRPKQLDEALALLTRSDVATVPLGGGTQLVAEARREVQAVVDLRELGLSYVRREDDVLHIGATTTLQALIDSAESAQAWGGELARVLTYTAARNLREQGTLAGTLMAAENNNPLAVLLLALDVSITIVSRHQEMPPTVLLVDFLPQRQSLLHQSLITEITIPLPQPSEAVAFEKVGRTPADLPIVCAAVRARFEAGIAREVRVGLGGVAAQPIRAIAVEQTLEGRAPDRSAIETALESLSPLADFLGSAEYRREMAAVLIWRAIEQLR
ncbi:MAG TPA: FAD binding domain-containing protein [Anaerolineae bacterium]|nr:FAD binding domain-containing protein [Anaerolineae bacterium]